MAEAEQKEIDLNDEDIVDGLPKKKFNGKMVVIGAVGLVVLAGVGFGVMSFFSGGDESAVEQVDPTEKLAQETADRIEEESREADKTPEELKLLFHPLPGQTFNLKTDGEGTSFLLLEVALELDRESFKAEVEAKQARVLDELNAYMRELRPSDLNGAAGIFRLKEELLMRINQAVAPARVKDVLLQKFVVQG